MYRTMIITSTYVCIMAISFFLTAGIGVAEDMPSVALAIDAGNPGPRIDRNMYGHFSERLGTCIYGGYWVSEDSPIPNTNGIRNDVVEALKAGGAAAT